MTYTVKFSDGQFITVTGMERAQEHGQRVASKLGLIVTSIEPSRPDNSPKCHYCGQSTNGTGFFGEPACSECGG